MPCGLGYVRFFFLILLTTSLSFLPSAFAAHYYKEQTDFAEAQVPTSGFTWSDGLRVCIFKEVGITNSYYAWAKLAVQEWRQALHEYSGDSQGWSMTARYSQSEADMEGCNVKVYIRDTYKDFPEYPKQTGAYTAVQHMGPDAESASVYLSSLVLHGDGKTEIKLPSYAFRNSAVHEMGHVLGLGHMGKEKNYLMSPVFDYFENKDQLPITTLELSTLLKLYGADGFNHTISIL